MHAQHLLLIAVAEQLGHLHHGGRRHARHEVHDREAVGHPRDLGEVAVQDRPELLVGHVVLAPEERHDPVPVLPHEGQPQQHPHLHGPQLVLLRQLLEVLVVRFRGLHAHVAQHRPAVQLQVFGVLPVRAEVADQPRHGDGVRRHHVRRVQDQVQLLQAARHLELEPELEP